MFSTMPYSSGITAELFMYREMKIVAPLYLDGKSVIDAIQYIREDNLFQYPTERSTNRIVRSCYKRLKALDNTDLIYDLLHAHHEASKQINLYAFMRYSRLVCEFMIEVIGEKYRRQDYIYTRKDINIFFSRLQEQNDEVAAWSERTVRNLKSILNNCLIETDMLNSLHDTTLTPIIISEELERGIRQNEDLTALAAFNCFRVGV